MVSAAGLALLSLFCSTLAAEDKAAPPSKPVSFYREVRPILVDACQGCHQPAKAGGKIVLVSHADLGADGRSKKAVVVPGKPGDSLLLRQITPEDGAPPEMPKENPPLAPAAVDVIRRWIAEGALDDTPGTDKVMVSAERPPVYTKAPLVSSLDFSPDGTLLAVSGYHEVLLHSVESAGPPGGTVGQPGGTVGQPCSTVGLAARLVGLAERIESAVFSPDGKLLAVTGGTPCLMGEVQVWDVAERKLRLAAPVTHDTVYGASWSPDGNLIAFGCADNTIRAIEAATGQQVFYNGAHNDWGLDTVFSTDGSHLVSVSRDRSMKLFQVKTQQFLDNITSITPGALAGGLMAVDRHPTKEELLVCGADGIPKVFKMHRTQQRQIGDDFNLLRKFDPVAGRLFAGEFSSDGKRIVVGSSNDRRGEVRVYQTEDGKLLWSWTSPCAIYAVAFSPDQKRVAAGGFDGLVRLLDGDTGTPVVELIPVPLGALERAL